MKNTILDTYEIYKLYEILNRSKISEDDNNGRQFVISEKHVSRIIYVESSWNNKFKKVKRRKFGQNLVVGAGERKRERERLPLKCHCVTQTISIFGNADWIH